MKNSPLLCLAIALSSINVCLAQNPVLRGKVPRHDPTADLSWSKVVPTPEMWMYERQKRDHLDTSQAIRRRAEHRAWQRQHRLAAQRWYGFSPARPRAPHTPFTTGSYNSFSWRTGAAPIAVLPFWR